MAFIQKLPNVTITNTDAITIDDLPFPKSKLDVWVHPAYANLILTDRIDQYIDVETESIYDTGNDDDRLAQQLAVNESKVADCNPDYKSGDMLAVDLPDILSGRDTVEIFSLMYLRNTDPSSVYSFFGGKVLNESSEVLEASWDGSQSTVGNQVWRFRLRRNPADDNAFFRLNCPHEEYFILRLRLNYSGGKLEGWINDGSKKEDTLPGGTGPAPNYTDLRCALHRVIDSADNTVYNGSIHRYSDFLVFNDELTSSEEDMVISYLESKRDILNA